MNDYLDNLSWLCIVVTVGSFSAGIPPCRQILQRGTTDNIPFMPFINGAVINIAILCYGILKEDSTVTIVNSIGSLLHVCYVILYNVYSHRQVDTYRKTIYGFCVLFALYLYLTKVVIAKDVIIVQLGMFTTVIMIAGNVSPLFVLPEVMRSKSSHVFPLSFTAAMLATSALWLLYGLAVDDVFILIPSVTGTVSSLIQLIFIVMYPPRKPSYKVA